MRIVIYGTGRMSEEFSSQIECFNLIFPERAIDIVAYTETKCKGGEFRGKPVLPVQEAARLKCDAIVIASIAAGEIMSFVRGLPIKAEMVWKESFCPMQDGRTVSQMINSFYLESIGARQMTCRGGRLPGDEAASHLWGQFSNPLLWQDILGRKRLFPSVEAKEKATRGCEVRYDSQKGLKYAVWNGHPIYYPRKWSDERISEYHPFNIYTCMDEESAHRYLSDGFCPTDEDVVVDLGAAEGLFALSVIDTAKRVYIFDGDGEWIQPLSATFEGYRDKVVIENMFISNFSWGNFTTLDDYFQGKEATFVKMDIEGSEQKALMGARDMLKRERMAFVIATYHRPEDMDFISAFMESAGYSVEQVPHWLWVDHKVFGADPFGSFRKAMLHASRKCFGGTGCM